MFRKVLGDPPVGQIAFTFTMIGFLNALLLWPVCLGLYLTETETIVSNQIVWSVLFIASILLLGKFLFSLHYWITIISNVCNEVYFHSIFIYSC